MAMEVISEDQSFVDDSSVTALVDSLKRLALVAPMASKNKMSLNSNSTLTVESDLLRSIVRQFQANQPGYLAGIRADLEIMAARSRRPRVEWRRIGLALGVVYPWWKAHMIRRKLKKWTASELSAACRQIDVVVVNRIPTSIDGGTPPAVSSINDSLQQPSCIQIEPPVHKNLERVEEVLAAPEPNSLDTASDQAAHGSARE